MQERPGPRPRAGGRVELVDEADADRWRRALARAAWRGALALLLALAWSRFPSVGHEGEWTFPRVGPVEWIALLAVSVVVGLLTLVEAWAARRGGPWAAVGAVWLAGLVLLPVAVVHVVVLAGGGPLEADALQRVADLRWRWWAAPPVALACVALASGFLAGCVAWRRASDLAGVAGDLSSGGYAALVALALNLAILGWLFLLALAPGVAVALGVAVLLGGCALDLADHAERVAWRRRHGGRALALRRRLVAGETTSARVWLRAYAGKADATLTLGADAPRVVRAPAAWARGLAGGLPQAVVRALGVVARLAVDCLRADLEGARPPGHGPAPGGGGEAPGGPGLERAQSVQEALVAWTRVHDGVREDVLLGEPLVGPLADATDRLLASLGALRDLPAERVEHGSLAALTHVAEGLDPQARARGSQGAAEALAAAALALAPRLGAEVVLDAVRAELVAWVDHLDARAR